MTIGQDLTWDRNFPNGMARMPPTGVEANESLANFTLNAKSPDQPIILKTKLYHEEHEGHEEEQEVICEKGITFWVKAQYQATH